MEFVAIAISAKILPGWNSSASFVCAPARPQVNCRTATKMELTTMNFVRGLIDSILVVFPTAFAVREGDLLLNWTFSGKGPKKMPEIESVGRIT